MDHAAAGGRKTTDLAGVLIALLATQAPPLSRSYVGASDLDQATELVDAASGLIARTPAVAQLLSTTELTIVNKATGATVTALPADVSAMGCARGSSLSTRSETGARPARRAVSGTP
jgi:hypothetical protein